MEIPIFFVLLAINFNVASANPHGTIKGSKSLNGMSVVCQWAALGAFAWALARPWFL